MVMTIAERNQIFEIGATHSTPPNDVMDLAQIESDAATGNATCWVERPQCPPLCPVRQACRSAKIELTRCIEHDAVANDDGEHVSTIEELEEDSLRNLHRQAPIDERRSVLR